MDREQAAEIHRHLQRAANAIRRAERLALDLSQDDRRAFAEPLGNIVTALHFELLQAIYRRFPDLRPPSREKARINSKLTWDKVRLPPPVTVLDFDRAILSTISPQWRKTARIVGTVSEQYGKLGIDLDPAIVAARLMTMVDSGLLEAAGDLRMWRFSEVRLKD
ncbi:MAG TPA: DUF3658 domain-containing protein [Bradyrhizobium sp.]|uniref:DUF3658 domain-containing protein n=1 Tax=Bradyrhizobium sp. TaxID=376 RepID=UPI002D0B1FA3|nr:DUF3658 domain-containing protein [Bradyrhizobium sp.]HLZ01492.1 DUF3658 domain-containing protein [Bradyrhizobium sp.]